MAAGEAQIESTVMGNASELLTSDPHQALVDRGQVFLPTNNALTPVGHVHCYLAELGQGIQVRAPYARRRRPLAPPCFRAVQPCVLSTGPSRVASTARPGDAARSTPHARP